MCLSLLPPEKERREGGWMFSQAKLRGWGDAGPAPHLVIANSAPDTRYPSFPYSGLCRFPHVG